MTMHPWKIEPREQNSPAGLKCFNFITGPDIGVRDEKKACGTR